ncbi:hypothetical protein C7476_11529 [Phyllobacterium bourgognense]|uniref:Uncharacterized protein n=1 Tax=Phyllobacterium bourgognense TaxID=314236 RepID=A0A368YPJ1_9HYPH|nr:hypothetical protein C7476_11529 [Phyllobacterium bourgognense]
MGAAMRVWALSTVKSSGPIKGLSSSHARGMETAAPTRARVGLAVQAREMPSTVKLSPWSFESPLAMLLAILHGAHVPRSQMMTGPHHIPLGESSLRTRFIRLDGLISTHPVDILLWQHANTIIPRHLAPGAFGT